MSGWTKGPWWASHRPADGTISEHADNENWSICTPEGRFVAGVKLQPEEESNARLIAAAPEMADFIADMMERRRIARVNDEAYRQGCAILARINGKGR